MYGRACGICLQTDWRRWRLTAARRRRARCSVPLRGKGRAGLGNPFGFEGLGGGVDGELVDRARGGGTIEGKSEIAGEDEKLVGGFGKKFLRLGAERIGLDVESV